MGDRLRSAVRRAVWPASTSVDDAQTVVAHEWFTAIGGSDKVAARLARLVDADVVYSYAVDRELVDRLGFDVPVVTWRFGEAAARFGRFPIQLFVMPIVWAALDLPACRQLVTSSHSCVNAVRADAAHRTSYVHTPMRYAWEWRLERDRLPAMMRWAMPAAAAWFRWLDRRWSRRVDQFVANSLLVKDRIRRSYGAQAVVVNPPIDVEFWTPEPGRALTAASATNRQASFVVAGRLVPYKRPDLAVDAALRAGATVTVAGSGSFLDELRDHPLPGVHVIERPSDDDLRQALRNADALLFPGIEDFGMLPLEAQACGTPVVARRAGGALETVLDGETGSFVDGDGVDEWVEMLEAFDPAAFDRTAVRTHAESFAAERFDGEILRIVAAAQ